MRCYGSQPTARACRILNRITKLDAEIAENELHLEKSAESHWAKAA
jgi:hypothetical protein